jgi:hypothetical protein
LVTLYFLFCFAVVLTLRSYSSPSTVSKFYALSAVIVSALVAGKVVVVLNHTSLGTRFDADNRPGLAALYKTLVYTVVAIFIVTGEKVFHAYRESDALGIAITEVRENRDGSLIRAKALYVSPAFLGYHLFVAADSRLGKATRWRELWV